ncbi:hypothetical protein BGZ74_005900 [Mortierella antarctica]|nr:hypothetical protein BGZ74_005900 [Mortierella antarctica]
MFTDKQHEANRESWNNAVVAHNSHKLDQDKFFREKGSTLYQEEKDLLGSLFGLKVCHLQCNAGQDTLSLVTKLGAENPVGVDISDTAIEFAQKLSRESGIPATFIRSDVFAYFETAEPEQFDVVFVSYGAVNWLSSMKTWAQGIHKILKPGGRLCLVEFHPVAYMFDEHQVQSYPYSSSGSPIVEDGVSDYVALSATPDGELHPNLKYTEGIKDFCNTAPTYSFCWGLGDILGALADTHLHMIHFKEYPYSNFYKFYSNMTPERVEEGTRWHPVGHNVPLMFSIAFKKHRK